MNLPLLALLPWLGAVLVACLPGRARRSAAWLAGAAALGVTGLALACAPALYGGAVLRWSLPWLPGLDLQLGLRLDGLAWMFALLIGGIGALVVLYAAWYLDADEPAPRFFSLLLLFMGAMLGVVLADNLLLLVLFWELTSLASFLLIGFWHRRDDARSGALTALTVTGAGGLCLLAGALLLGHMAGSMQLDVVLASGDAIRAHPLYNTTLVLVLLGALTKSAQFPFHFWLPQAMAAPTPVSAYLHSATMVKAGIFLLARLYPALGGSEPWFWILTLAGAATLLLGAWVAIFQHDLKGLLAYSTLSHLGLITLLLGLSEPLALVAALFHTVNHAIFKAGLFMSAGIIDHACGTRDMRRINGLMKYMPVTALLGITAAAAMAGVPLLNGFLSKEMFFAETLTLGSRGAMAWLLPALALLAGALGMAYSLRFVHDVFFNGAPVNLPRAPHEAPFFLRLPLLLLVALCLAVGVAPQWTVAAPLALAAQAALYGHPGPALPTYHLALWHGLNLPLLMSALAVVLGTSLYFGLQRVVNLHHVTRQHPLVRFLRWAVWGTHEILAAAQAMAMALARGVTATLQNGKLQHYLRLLLGVALAAGTLPFLGTRLPHDAPPFLPGAPTFAVVAVALSGYAATLATVVAHRQRLVAVLMLGAVGLVVCLAFAWFSAPDLAITQLLVDMVAVLLMTQALRWLPAQGERETSRGMRVVDAAIALGAGTGLAALAWQVLAHPSTSIADYYLQAARPLGGGGNVVNVIIVDFRAFDTLGEIVVLVIAALTLHALLSPFTPPLGARTGMPQPQHREPPFLLHAAAGAALPLALLLALHLFLRGHNLPGGGFAAALVLALALVLQRVALPDGDARPARAYRFWMGAGLLLAVATGAASWLWGAPFLTSTWDYPWLPGVGGVPLASAMALDLGVLLVVLGAAMTMLHALARASARSN
jgi:multicomponent K+:H+ antiporter subunit A